MFRYTLVAEGPSDRALIPILDWLIEQHSTAGYESQFAEHLPPHRSGLSARISAALRIYPCDLLFVHRDADRADVDERVNEIYRALPQGSANHVLVVPVRMTEAWLLSDEAAIRAASDNPNGVAPLDLSPRRWDHLPDPKSVLRTALRTATGLPARRLERFDPDSRRVRVAELTDSFSRLRDLPAFTKLEDDLSDALRILGLH